ncbi:MAG: hypothetical protein KatS3mg068_1503 [Candidatus Sericytochromatia bacterium]|nr:MAG: hypothetical protein KatS3mg068_1503 [Candidatus Sericytochromatia bacterium]
MAKSFDIDYFFNSGGRDKKVVLNELYFEIINFLKTIPFQQFLDPNYGITIYQFENENMTNEKLILLQTALIMSLIQFNDTLPDYKRFVVNPFTVRVKLEDNELKIGILVILEQDFISNTTTSTGILDDDVLRIVETIKL